MNGYDFEYIDKLRIHELRDFAKKLGVSSPTTMKKEELIEKINTIIQGDSYPIDKSNRINHKEFDFFELLVAESSEVLDSLLNLKKDNSESLTKNNTIVMKKNPLYENDSYSSKSMVGFSFNIKQNEAKVSDEEIYDISGYLDIHPKGYGILRADGFVPNDNDSVLSSALIRKLNLKKGYFIRGKAKLLIENKPKIVYSVYQIEDVKKMRNGQNFDLLPYNGLGKALYLNKFDLSFCKGERNYIANMSLRSAFDLGLDIVEENPVNVKFVNVKARPEENYESIDKLKVINIPFNKSEHEVVNAVNLVLERIKREAELGLSNVLILYNFSELIRIFNVACFDGVIDFVKFNSQAITKINNLLYLAKHVDNNLNCSVLCIDKNGAPEDIKKIIDLEFMPLFNKVIESLDSKK